ncbi:MAG: (2Fe-2S)-binding protein [Deltaproteobacteria bacterium]|nr:(2Fe-2S)-binding protein [Deltaproteobacteria bacterium]
MIKNPTTPSDTITITLDGQPITAKKGEILLDVARRNGAFIPTLCHLDGLTPYGACRLCTVKVKHGSWSKFVTSCNYPIWDGLEVETATDEVNQNRKLVIEALLSRAPKAPVLQNLAKTYGVTTTRFPNLDPAEKCILCGLCVRVCDDVVGAHAIGFVGRGQDRRVGIHINDAACIGCGACSYVCPTDAIDMESVTVGHFRDRWGEDRPCRYSLMGLLPGSVCHNNYECWRCETDQTIMDLCQPVHPVFVARGIDNAGVRSVIRKMSVMIPPDHEDCDDGSTDEATAGQQSPPSDT